MRPLHGVEASRYGGVFIIAARCTPAHGMHMFIIAARCLHQLMAGLTNVDMLARIRMPLLLPVPSPRRRAHPVLAFPLEFETKRTVYDNSVPLYHSVLKAQQTQIWAEESKSDSGRIAPHQC